MTATALIIDDEPDIRELIAMTLARMGLDFHSAANLEEARQLLATYKFDVCLTDMRLPDGNGVEFVRYVQSVNPHLPVAVITAHGNMEAAVDAMKNGAYDFVSKPVDIGQLRQLVVRAISLNSESASNDSQHTVSNGVSTGEQQSAVSNTAGEHTSANLHALSKRSQHNDKTGEVESSTATKLIGSSEPMQALRKMIHKVARTNAPVWITGESGTGKELIAKLIHENSPRNHKPFVAINCGAIPSELMESELFGHIKGSFTGATADKAGLFKLADGGTLFLDEVAELPLHMQVKLLRAIQERSIRPVGGSAELAVDARILSASHADLATEVDAGRFRHDLYYRLNVISMHSPSLRERASDIPELCDNIMHKLAERTDQNRNIVISEDAFDAMAHYKFPGNVRELENILERASALIDKDTITADDLNLPETNNHTRNINNDDKDKQSNATQCNETNRIVDTLNKTHWNRKEAAIQLGLTYRQLRYRIKQLGIDAKK